MRTTIIPARGVTRIIKRDTEAERRAAEHIHPGAKRILPHGLLFAPIIVCNECAARYEPGLVDLASFKDVDDAFLRISEALVGRSKANTSEWEPVCYDCEAEL